MEQIEQAEIEPIRTLLRQAAPGKARDLEVLFRDLAPQFEIDHSDERILFEAHPDRNLVRVGSKSIRRLFAHANAASVVLARIGTPGLMDMAAEQRNELFAVADRLLTWAVSRDLQQSLKEADGGQPDLDAIMQGAEQDLPDGLLSSLSEAERVMGDGLFRTALAFILLHEFGHLKFGHRRAEGFWSYKQEKDSDRFAAGWLMTSPDGRDVSAYRLNRLLGIAVAELWLTVFNVFFGRLESKTHPEGYDRLLHVLDHFVDRSDVEEYQIIWFFVRTMVFAHMDTAGYKFDESDSVDMQGDQRDVANHLINRISNFRPERSDFNG
jgi:hypothetical protein